MQSARQPSPATVLPSSHSSPNCSSPSPQSSGVAGSQAGHGENCAQSTERRSAPFRPRQNSQLVSSAAQSSSVEALAVASSHAPGNIGASVCPSHFLPALAFAVSSTFVTFGAAAAATRSASSSTEVSAGAVLSLSDAFLRLFVSLASALR